MVNTAIKYLLMGQSLELRYWHRKFSVCLVSLIKKHSDFSFLLWAEVFYYINYSVKNSTVDCKYLLYFLGVSRFFFLNNQLYWHFLYCFGFNLKKKSCRKVNIYSWIFDRIIDVYIIDVINLGYRSRKMLTPIAICVSWRKKSDQTPLTLNILSQGTCSAFCWFFW